MQGVKGPKMWFCTGTGCVGHTGGNPKANGSSRAELGRQAQSGTQSVQPEPGGQLPSQGRDLWTRACDDKYEISSVVGPSRSASSLPRGWSVTKQNSYFIVLFFNLK